MLKCRSPLFFFEDFKEEESFRFRFLLVKRIKSVVCLNNKNKYIKKKKKKNHTEYWKRLLW